MKGNLSMYQTTSGRQINAKCEALGNIHLVNRTSVSNWNTLFPIFKIRLEDVVKDDARVHSILATYNEPENALRQIFNLPKIGEGWISETNLYYEIKEHFTSEIVLQHGRPNWLGKQHLDIWLPKRNVGVEYQGDQHFYPIDFFGGKKALVKNKARDKRKRELCEQNGCGLVHVLPGYELKDVLTEIERLVE
jgi:hypothetical protein